MTVVGLKFSHSLGITKSELIPLSHGVNAANNQGLGLLGGALITFSGEDCYGNIHTSRQLCYVASNIDTVFLSKSACMDLGLISKSFPTVGTFNDTNLNAMSKSDEYFNKHDQSYLHNSSKSSEEVKDISKQEKTVSEVICTCPKRQLPPSIPKSLPYPAKKENREKLKGWILEHYASSVFNQCEHQPLPLMCESPPIKLHILMLRQKQFTKPALFQFIGEMRLRLA